MKIENEAVYNFLGKIIGYIDGETYITERRPEHFMRMFGGFGISKTVLELLETRNVKNIVIIYFGKKGLLKHYFTLDEYLNFPTDIREYEEAGIKDMQHFRRLRPLKEKPKEIQSQL